MSNDRSLIDKVGGVALVLLSTGAHTTQAPLLAHSG